MGSKKYYSYITGLKGLSCVFIMIGHFLGVYSYSQYFMPRISFLDTILNSKIGFFLYEGYWLYLFFFISGYLLSKTQVKTITDVITKSITRFFRLAFPILFSYLVIYLIYRLIGFYNGQTAYLFQCDWFQIFYSDQYSIMDVLRGPIDVLFLRETALNGPFWVLREMLMGSIMIYILKYIYFILSKKNEVISFSVLVIITFAFAIVSPIITGCLVGMLIDICENIEGILDKQYFWFWIIMIALLQYIFNGTYVFNIIWVLAIVCVPKVKCFDAIFSSKPVEFLGKISWGIYSFHWPVICSFGAICIIKLQSQIGLTKSYVIACILSVLITMIVSVVYYFTFERLSSRLYKTIDTYLRRIVSRLSILVNQ